MGKQKNPAAEAAGLLAARGVAIAGLGPTRSVDDSPD
jgi:hypothetical protein